MEGWWQKAPVFPLDNLDIRGKRTCRPHVLEHRYDISGSGADGLQRPNQVLDSCTLPQDNILGFSLLRVQIDFRNRNGLSLRQRIGLRNFECGPDLDAQRAMQD